MSTKQWITRTRVCNDMRDVYRCRFVCLLICLFLVHVCGGEEEEEVCELNRTSISMGLISPWDGPFGYETNAAATSMAITNAKNAGYIRGLDVTITWRNGACNAKSALGNTVILRDMVDPDIYFGLPCSIAAINAGRLIAFWNLPHFSYSSPEPTLADKVMYETLIRLVSPFNNLAKALTALFRKLDWTQAVNVHIFSADNLDDYCNYASTAFQEEFLFTSPPIEIALWLRNYDTMTDAEMDAWLIQIQTRGRIVLICCPEDVLRRFMLRAYALNMCNGDYVFIFPGLLPSDNMEVLWENGGDDDMTAMKAYQPLLQIALGMLSTAEAAAFRQELPLRMAEPPWNYNDTFLSGKIGSVYSLYLHDAVYLYAMALDQVIRSGECIRRGDLIFNITKTLQFDGKSGKVAIDSNGDRIGDYWIWQLRAGMEKYELWAKINISQPAEQQVEYENARNWGVTGTDPPPSVPFCGFYNEDCPETTGDIVAIAVSLGIVVIIAGIVFVIFIYRRKKYEEELELMKWMIRYDDISMMGHTDIDKVGSKVSMFTTSISGSGASLSVSGFTGHRPNLFLGHYKGGVVVCKKLHRANVILTRADQIELKQMRDLNHENINPFVGMCIDPPNVCIVNKYCTKGSLRDILETENIKLDLMFKSSLLVDLITGLEYIHKSPLKSMGRLRSTNCVIDGRWVLKLTDFGLHTLRDCPDEEAELYKSMLWTAPELLRDPKAPICGTQKGDIFSFAIIMQETIYRCNPYETTGVLPMVHKDLVGRVKNGETPAYRPELQTTDMTDRNEVHLLNLIRECWHENPANRPDVVAVKNRFLSMNKGKRYNIMDNMIRMLEKYANNLEEIVNDRTKELMVEKKKTETLLYRMLPSTIADALKAGKEIEPEMFKSASIYFSDIVGFTSLSSESSPMEIIDFLNDLWTEFDDTIAQHNIYKVETIGDAYMVVSGLPALFENHATEIADMALAILSCVITFKIRHRPNDQLRVRIGIHSGPVAAGVVGLTMPRYCLFGDTVNTSSRMESTGLPLRIQVSSTTHSRLVISNQYLMAKRGEIAVKGKGQQTTYWLYGKQGFAGPLPPFDPRFPNGMENTD